MTSEWVWQGFYGPMASAQAAWEGVTVGASVGVLVPLEGGAMPVDEDGEDGMFAVQTRANAPMPKPAGMKIARPEMVARMVGA
jgi:hypothetical protein